jgi:hypothetical protein
MMPYDPQGTGASPDDLLVRRGTAWESPKRLAAQAAQAEVAGNASNARPFGHGVSVTSVEANRLLARVPDDAVLAKRKAFEEAGFEVHYTPTRSDTDHHTVQLPKPMTEEVAARFNTVLGRARKVTRS